MSSYKSPHVGRGAVNNPPNRFETRHVVYDGDEPLDDDSGRMPTEVIRDSSRTVIATNDSPDVGFEVSINPYRGCEHGCSYCFARPTHEYLGFSAGLDFETKILYKPHAPELLRRELASPKWVPRTIAISGVTDAYQPIERRLGLTRRCLAVLADFRNPVGVVTKGALVTRDVDLLAKLASFDAACVILSITTLDRELARTLEPRASLPEQRLRAIEALATCKVPVGVMTAPIIPGLNDHEIPRILEAAHQAGARFAAYVPLRLPGNVLPVFTEWLEHHTPDKRDRVLGRIRDMRDGRLNNPRFGERMRGKGPVAEAIEALFATTCRRLGLKRGGPKLDTSAFRNPDATKQLALFE